jgi:hypothetical protein
MSFSFAALTSAAMPPNASSNTCGTSASQAQTHGCRFDPMLYAWVPNNCFPVNANGWKYEFRNFKFFEDLAHMHPLNNEEVLAGTIDPVYTANDYHRAHCLYAWQLLIDTTETRRHFADTVTLSQGHLGHCLEFMIQGNQSMNAVFGIDYLVCEETRLNRGDA